MRNVSLFLALIAGVVAVTGAEPLRLSIWQNGAPIGNGKSEKADVSVAVHLAETNASGMAVVICPGGGYATKVMQGEGYGIARWLNANGIAGVVLDYRLPQGNYHRPILDAQRAIRFVRAHATEWKIKPDRIGIIGFSAGGHLASSAATHFDNGNANSVDPIERLSSRPDFAILVYPVISLGEKGHGGTRKNLLGQSPPGDLLELFSNEKQVTKSTPPTFLTHAKTDMVVPVENSQMFYEALKANHVAAELLEFPQGTHGYSGYKGKEWDGWQKRSIEWLKETFDSNR